MVEQLQHLRQGNQFMTEQNLDLRRRLDENARYFDSMRGQMRTLTLQQQVLGQQMERVINLSRYHERLAAERAQKIEELKAELSWERMCSDRQRERHAEEIKAITEELERCKEELRKANDDYEAAASLTIMSAQG
jgi:chromosome segregation ATPase